MGHSGLPYAGGIATSSPLALTEPHPPLIADPRPTLKLVIVHRQTVFARREDEHPGADQLIADVAGWAGIPGARGDPGGLGQDVVTAVGDLAQLFYGFVEVAALGGVRIAVP